MQIETQEISFAITRFSVQPQTDRRIVGEGDCGCHPNIPYVATPLLADGSDSHRSVLVNFDTDQMGSTTNGAIFDEFLPATREVFHRHRHVLAATIANISRCFFHSIDVSRGLDSVSSSRKFRL